ncbi:MAG: hypothetical protein U0798_04345 [Gemmataceae bacterium]
MRKIFTLAILFSAALAGLGCQHTAGRCDCTHHAEDAHLQTPTNPYPVVGGEKAAK